MLEVGRAHRPIATLKSPLKTPNPHHDGADRCTSEQSKLLEKKRQRAPCLKGSDKRVKYEHILRMTKRGAQQAYTGDQTLLVGGISVDSGGTHTRRFMRIPADQFLVWTSKKLIGMRA